MNRLLFTARGNYPYSITDSLKESLRESIRSHMAAYGVKDIEVREASEPTQESK